MRCLASARRAVRGPKITAPGRTNGSAAGLKTPLQSVAAQLAFCNSRIVSLPLEAGNVIRTCNGAIAAADAFIRCPTDNARLRIFVQGLEGTARRAGWVQTLHALPLHKRVRRPVFRLIEFDNVAREFVQISRGLMQVVAADILGRVVGLRTSRLASLASNTDAGVIQQSDRCARKGNLLRLQGLGRDGESYGRRHSGLGDGGEQCSPSDGHISPLSSELASLPTI